MKKILYLCRNLEVGGAEQLLLTTVKYLDRSRFAPVVYCLGSKGRIGEEIESRQVKVTALNRGDNLLSFGTVRVLAEVLRREKPDILHTHIFYANYFGRIAAVVSGVPAVVVTEHGTYSNFKKFYHHCADFLLSFFTFRIIAVSRAVEKYIRRHSSIPAKKITVVYNAVDFDRFQEACRMDREAVRKAMSFDDSDLVIGCVSTLAPWKGQMYLLKAFVEVSAACPQAKLCIIGRGNGAFAKELADFVKSNNLSEKVRFMGECRDVPQALRAFDIFVFPSLTEGLGICLLEAMYMGLAVVASAAEGILEIIEDGKDGVLTPGADHEMLARNITMLITDAQKRQALGLKAKEKIEKAFSPQAYINKLQSVYSEAGRL